MWDAVLADAIHDIFDGTFEDPTRKIKYMVVNYAIGGLLLSVDG
jgi:hypothetical protein